MTFELKWNASDEMRAMRRKKKARPPKTPAYATRYWQAWNVLRNDRQYVGLAGVPVGISFMAIHVYAERYGFAEQDEFETLVAVVRALDAEYLEWHSQRSK